MDITIDTSALMAVLLNESARPRVVELTRDAELLAPQSLHWEIGNALSALFRRGRIAPEVATRALDYYQEIPIRLVAVPLGGSLELAARFGHYAYDAYMLECARRFNTPLLTLDQPLQRTAREMGLELLKVEEEE